MKKIFIVGIVASGKTTLAKHLSQQLNIPWHELDRVVHQDHVKTKRTAQEQVAFISEINESQEKWIFEGTDRKSYQCLFDMADTIIYLDPPLWIRRKRIVTRYLKQQMRLERSHYKSNLQMLRMMFKWTNDYERNRQVVEKKMELYQTKLIKISTQRSLNNFLESITLQNTEDLQWLK